MKKIDFEKIDCVDSQKYASESHGSILSKFRGLCSCKQSNRADYLCRCTCKFCELMKQVENSHEICRNTNTRAGFGMMFAIIITILVATLGVLAVRFSTQTLNTTTNEYIAIQLDLYLNSTTELAILYVQRHGFVCNENAKICDVGDNNPGADIRANVNASIEKYISYGVNSEYNFKYKMTPLDNYNKFDATVYQQKFDGTCVEEDKVGGRCFKEEIKNAFILDISGSVTNPITNQTLRVTKRQIIKP